MTSENSQPTLLGQWQSPVTAASLAQANTRLAAPTVHDGIYYWLEGRPSEQGRTVLVCQDASGQKTDLTPAPFNVRTRAHEYGGGAYTVHKGTVYFINYDDQAIYRITPDQISKVYAKENLRFADLLVDEARQRLIVAVEDHNAQVEPEGSLCCINLADSTLQVLARGADFYSSPTLNHDGRQLAWLTWMHPYMPWESTQLHLADINSDGSLQKTRLFGEDESIFQPTFGPDNKLYFCSDRDNWWNLYCLDSSATIQRITRGKHEIGMPQWVFGMRVFDFVSKDTIACTKVDYGISSICLVDVASGQITPTKLPYTAVEHLAGENHQIVCHAASPTCELSIIKIELDQALASTDQILQSPSEHSLSQDFVSTGQTIEFKTTDDETAHGFYYEPKNPNHMHKSDTRAPLLVLVHGGPTTATNNGLNPRVQFWTSRGFAVLDVNYRGSTGYGREYRQKLNGQWGIKDVQDCVHGAHYLAHQQFVDINKLFIMGGSAGGYTVLGALAFTDCFAAGISSYGIGDLAVLMDDTHKFESRYTISLVGPYDKTLYRSRSPLFSAQDISSPVLFFQGSEDKVVPPNQAEMMVAALKENNILAQYVVMEGEGHGFRRSDSIEKMLTTSLEFLCQRALNDA